MKNKIYILNPIVFFIFFSSCISSGKFENFSYKKKGLSVVENAPLRIQKEDFPLSGKITVKNNDNIYDISMRYGLTPQSIIRDNNLKSPFKLSNGQEIKLTPNNYHIIKKGDNLFSLSQRYAVSQFQIANLNNLNDPFELTIGDKLLIPKNNDFSVLEEFDSKKNNNINNKIIIIPKNENINKRKEVNKKLVEPNFSDNNFSWPLRGEIVNEFGPVAKGVHNDGVNISASQGTPVATTAPGEVVYIGKNLKSFGTLVLVKHEGRIISAYAHLQNNINISEGSNLKAGDIIGYVGSTGKVETPQLHFEVRKNRIPINPRDIIS